MPQGSGETTAAAAAKDAPFSLHEVSTTGARLDDSHFQLPIRRRPESSSNISEETNAYLSDTFEELDFDPQDDSSIGSWQDIPTPDADIADEPGFPAQTKTNETKEQSSEELSRTTTDGYEELYEAIVRGDIEAVAARLDDDVDLERETDDGLTALVMSILEDETYITKMLLERGADVHHRVQALPPLVHAVVRTKRAPQLIQLLIDHGANPNTVSGPDQMNALHWAAAEGMVDAVDFLISKGMNLDGTYSQGRTPLTLAAEKGYTVVVKLLVAKGAELYRRTRNGGTALQWAARNGHLDTVRYLLEEGISLDDCDDDGLTALSLASHLGHLEVVEFLIAKGADVNKSSLEPKDFTPAMAAATAGETEVLQALIRNGADLTIPNGDGKTILEAAISRRCLDTVKILLEAIGGPGHPQDSVALQMAMADTRATTQSLITTASLMCSHLATTAQTRGKFAWIDWVLESGGALVRPKAMSNMLDAALYERRLDMVEALLGHGCDPDGHVAPEYTPLSFAIRHHNVDLLRILLNAGADPAKPACAPEGTILTPLHEAIAALEDDSEKDISLVDMLLKSGRCKLLKGRHLRSTAFSYVLWQLDVWDNSLAEHLVFRMLDSVSDVNSDRCDDGSTLLHAAVYHSREDLIDILLEKGADINAANERGRTPFLMKCTRNSRVLKFLLTRGADPFVKDTRGHSGLHIAASRGKLYTLELLLDKGLDIEATTLDGDTPLLCALAAGQEDAALYLMDRGANLHVKCSKKGRNILHFAARLQMQRIVERILDDGSLDINSKDHAGWTPLAWACRRPSTKLVSTLIAAGADTEAVENGNDRPLDISLITGNDEVALLLVEHGVDLSTHCSRGRTPLHLAAQYNNPRTARLLLSKKVALEALDEDSRTPLSACNDPIVAQLLIDNGAYVHHADKDGWTPLHQAVSCGSIETFRVLLKEGAELKARTKNDGLNVNERIEEIKDEWLRHRFLNTQEEHL